MSNNKFKVLIVEDEANICSFIETLLTTNDYQALVAHTCTMGLTLFASTTRIWSFWIWACRTGTGWNSSVPCGRSI